MSYRRGRTAVILLAQDVWEKVLLSMVNWTWEAFAFGERIAVAPFSFTRKPRHRSFEIQPENHDWPSLRQQVEALRDEIENVSREVEAGKLDVIRLHNAGHLSHRVSLALFALQNQEMERIQQERDLLKKDYLDRARRRFALPGPRFDSIAGPGRRASKSLFQKGVFAYNYV